MLAGNIDNIALGMPGSSLSDITLTDVELPHVEEMVADSLEACCMFKRQAPVPEPAPSGPLKPANDFADEVNDLAEGETMRPHFTGYLFSRCCCCVAQS